MAELLAKAWLTLVSAEVTTDCASLADWLAVLNSVARLVEAVAESFAEAVDAEVWALWDSALAWSSLSEASLACDWATEVL